MNAFTVPTRQPRSQFGSRASNSVAQLSLLVAGPARRLTPAEVAEIRRAVAISTMSQPQPGDPVALYLDLGEQFGLSARAVMDIVAGHRGRA